MSETRDRIRGVLLGLAAGDRNGGPIRMAVRLAESLSDRRQFDPEDILSRYLAWWRDGAFDTGQRRRQCSALVDGGMDAHRSRKACPQPIGWHDSGMQPGTPLCAPGDGAFLPDGELAGCALREARLTHQHPLAGDVAAAVVVVCRALINGKTWGDALALARMGRLRQTIEALDGDNPSPLSPGGFAPEVLRAACPLRRSS